MNTETNNNHMQKLIVKRLIQVAVQFFLVAAILFLSSGQLDWFWAWVYLIVGLSGTLIATPIMLRTNPEVIAERAEIKENVKGWDKTFGKYSMTVTLAMLVVAGLDQRFGRVGIRIPTWTAYHRAGHVCDWDCPDLLVDGVE
jgi:hypothetical protein